MLYLSCFPPADKSAPPQSGDKSPHSMHPAPIILATVLALGAAEAVAYWWMHPTPAGLGQPVLCYRPQANGHNALATPQQIADAQADIAAGNSTPPTSNLRPPTSDLRPPTSDSPSSTFTPLPEVYAKSAPKLRCTSGQVFHVKRSADIGLHLAFFEWDATDTGSVLEAFRHLPDACMGSIGMTLMSREPPLPYQVGSESLIFDHTVFREPGLPGGITPLASQVHAFRAVWVSGLSAADARTGLAGNSLDHLRTIRFKSALTRFRPTYACVIQGAVRGATSPDAAWLAFQDAMLSDLRMATR